MSSPLQTVQERQRLLLESADSIHYKTVENGENLQIHFYMPDSHTEGSPRPVVLFFFSSGWDRGDVTQFAPQAMFFANRGAVAGLVEYRTSSSHQATPVEGMQDGRSAVRWVREHADKLNADIHRITVAGGRAGAHIAATLVLNSKLKDDPQDDPDVDGKPNGAILLSPIVELEKDTFGVSQFSSPGEAKEYSLSRYIGFDLRPMIIFHGTADRFIPCEQVALFAKKMKRKKNPCEFHPFDGREESFYNLNVDPFSYEAVMGECDDFLVKHGLLEENTDEENDARLISWREGDF